MPTAPKMKPAQAAGRPRNPAQALKGTPDLVPTGQSAFEDALHALQEDLLIELEKDVWGCERSTETAIRAAQPAERLSAFHSGFNEWGDKLCASVTRYYNTCFDIALANRLPRDYLLSLAKISSADKLRSPAGFAKGLTEAEISAFLRVTAFDRKEPAREIGSNGRVRWFVHHVCGDLFDVHPLLYAERHAAFRLPQWFQHEWNIKASMAKLAWRPAGSALRTPPIDESSFLSAEETEEFILDLEEMLIGKLRGSIAAAHREALKVLGRNGIATSLTKTEVIAANPSEKIRREMVLFVRHPDGTTAGQPPYTNRALLNTYERLWPLLDQVRAMVANKKQKLLANHLQQKFKATALGKAADTEDFAQWIEDFAGCSRATAKNAALVFLEKKTGRSRRSLKTLFSRGRSERTAEINHC